MSAAGGPGGPPGPAQPSKKLQQTQAQVDEVVDIMRVNVEKVLERDQKLSQLDERADALQAGASQFEASAGKLKNKYWWKNCKSMIMMGVVIAVVVIIVGVWIVTSLPKDGKSSGGTNSTRAEGRRL
ncbi:synaptobrevin isoform X10 [Lingula anatina]|uniref:Synaptobrevin isoform X10 n=1 Tax=Lingula anatina TaxID=7574 RepID=A0A1S3I6Y1_LINAN|nr:synaptobrevin isoform X10 [Lingula anatina]|eukprot:XP_013393968.1 synaptobrevin isoform X10 [Lingula anatina]